MRLIDADALMRDIEHYHLSDGKFQHWIDVQPTIEERKTEKWIPCSERLPHGSCSDLVNVSIHDDSGDNSLDYTSCGWVTTDGEYWIVDNEINNHVIAWMPLPEPWRGEEDGKRKEG